MEPFEFILYHSTNNQIQNKRHNNETAYEKYYIKEDDEKINMHVQQPFLGLSCRSPNATSVDPF